MDFQNAAETQFSIYKIDPERVKEEFPENKSFPSAVEIKNALVNSIGADLQNKGGRCTAYQLAHNGYDGWVFKTIHAPDWAGVIRQLGSKDGKIRLPFDYDFLSNAHLNYVLFYVHKESTYAMTGGLGSHYIRKYAERNYGLYLLPKILDINSPVVKHVVENNLTGNRVSTNRVNRNNTSFSLEQDLSSIYRELNVEIDRDIINALGIAFGDDELPTKKLNLINKDSLVIRRSLSLPELSRVIGRLSQLEAKPDRFALNYFMLARKQRFRKSDLTDQLVRELAAKDYKNFLIVGDGVEGYLLNASCYRLWNESDTLILEQNEPITMDDLYAVIAQLGKRLSNVLISTMLKSWRIEAVDHSGVSIFRLRKIFDSVQGFIEYGETRTPCYLINGDWYVFDQTYSAKLTDEYVSLFNHKRPDSSLLKEKWGLDSEATCEMEYNEGLKGNEQMIVSHPTTYQNVEFADAIFWDDSRLYLMHNKGSFDGVGARDLTNQILTAAECYQNTRAHSGSDFIICYFQAIQRRVGTYIPPVVDEQTFENLFATKRICFIACYLDGFSSDTRSTYAKYLTIEVNKKLASRNFDFIPMGIH